MKVTCVFEIPDELYQPLLQHIRDFDTKHDPDHEDKVKCYTLAEGSSMDTEEIMKAMMSISPPPQYVKERKFDS